MFNFSLRSIHWRYMFNCMDRHQQILNWYSTWFNSGQPIRNILPVVVNLRSLIRPHKYLVESYFKRSSLFLHATWNWSLWVGDYHRYLVRIQQISYLSSWLRLNLKLTKALWLSKFVHRWFDQLSGYYIFIMDAKYWWNYLWCLSWYRCLTWPCRQFREHLNRHNSFYWDIREGNDPMGQIWVHQIRFSGMLASVWAGVTKCCDFR